MPDGVETQEELVERLKAQLQALTVQRENLMVQRENLTDENKNLRDGIKNLTVQRENLIAQRENLIAKNRTLHENDESYVEFLRYCHYSILCHLKLELDTTLASYGSTAVDRKRHPPRIKFWSAFMEGQRERHDMLCDTFGEDNKVFPSPLELRQWSKVVQRKSVGAESTLMTILGYLLTDHIITVIEQCRIIPDIADRYRIGHDKIVFEPSFNAPQQKASDTDYTYRPNMMLLYVRNDEDTTMATLIMELKPPHKVSTEVLHKGLRSMDVKEVIERRMTAPESDQYQQQQAEKFVAKLMIQLFHYMTQAGVKYGCVTTGLAYVFVMIDYKEEPSDDSNEPITLYYYLSDPIGDVDASDGDLMHSAVGQMSAFVIMVLDEVSREEKPLVRERRKTLAQPLNLWISQGGVGMSKPPETQERPARKKRRKPVMGCEPRDVGGRERSDSDNDDKDDGPHRKMAVDRISQIEHRNKRALDRAQIEESRENSKLSRSSAKKTPEGLYCTHKCLLGLITNDILDDKCPNVDRHRGLDRPDDRHPIDHATWLRLLGEQLKQSQYQGVVPLGRVGGTGAIFQVTLLAYGYTVIGKGVVDEFVDKLAHEADAYERLEPIQGVNVPVFLGEIDLIQFHQRYIYGIDMELTYFLFMTWGGQSLDDPTVRYTGQVFRAMAKSLLAVYEQGVIHTDMRQANVLWDERTKQAMLIDFERSMLEDGPPPDLFPFVFDDEEEGEAGKQPNVGDEFQANAIKGYNWNFLALQADTFDASMLF